MNILVLGGRAGGRIAAESGYVAIIVDALRASATISSMFHFGVGEIEVVERIEEALAEREARPGITLLGERGGWQVEGFDLGNSPWQTAPDPVPEAVVFTSSNCSRCCIAAAKAPAAFLGTTVNASAAARLAYREARDRATGICIITAGSAENEERFVMEDHLAAGVIIRRLHALADSETELILSTDGAHASLICLDHWGEANLEAAFLATDNGTRLSTTMPFEADVRFASRIDVFDLAARIAGVRDLPSGGRGTVLARAS